MLAGRLRKIVFYRKGLFVYVQIISVCIDDPECNHIKDVSEVRVLNTLQLRMTFELPESIPSRNKLHSSSFRSRSIAWLRSVGSLRTTRRMKTRLLQLGSFTVCKRPETLSWRLRVRMSSSMLQKLTGSSMMSKPAEAEALVVKVILSSHHTSSRYPHLAHLHTD